MRIIAGTAGGRRIEAPQGDGTRPTHDRVREAVFSMIGPFFDGGRALDLFAGSGSLGLEAVSRGVDECLFFDADRRAVSVVQGNIKSLDMHKHCRVTCAKFQQALDSVTGKFDLIFLDPPYDAGYMLPALEKILARDLLNDEATVFCEIRAGTEFVPPEGLTQIKRRKYGMAEVIILKKTKVEETGGEQT